MDYIDHGGYKESDTPEQIYFKEKCSCVNREFAKYKILKSSF